MKLETIKHFIDCELPCISFEEYFIQYVCKMQDSNIDQEMKFLLCNDNLSVLDIESLINRIYEGETDA